jgi:membrane-bound inhibitor of C-type lysozyme
VENTILAKLLQNTEQALWITEMLQFLNGFLSQDKLTYTIVKDTAGNSALQYFFLDGTNIKLFKTLTGSANRYDVSIMLLPK